MRESHIFGKINTPIIFSQTNTHNTLFIFLVNHCAIKLEAVILSNEGRFQRRIEIESHQVDIWSLYLCCFIIIKLFFSQNLVDLIEILKVRIEFYKWFDSRRDIIVVDLSDERCGEWVFFGELFDLLGVQDFAFAFVWKFQIWALHINKRQEFSIRLTSRCFS